MQNEDYIKRSEAVARLTGKACCVNSPGKVRAFATAINVIETMPAADVEPKRKTGVWLEEEAADDGNWRYTCSVCGYADIQSRSAQVPFCWHCGSRMQKMDKDIEPPKETKDNETDTAL